MGEAWRDALNAYRDQMGHFKIDQVKVQEEVRRSVEQAEKPWRTRYATRPMSPRRPPPRPSANSKTWGHGRHRSSVTVRSSGDQVRSIVKADESGTIVIVSNPKPRLTVHDKEGKLRL